ncbi:hypothetical protein [Coleofasciculus sp. H7-2]
MAFLGVLGTLDRAKNFTNPGVSVDRNAPPQEVFQRQFLSRY